MNFQLKNAALAASMLLSVSATAFAADAMLATGGYARQLQKMEMMKMLDADGNHMVTAAEADSYYNSVFDVLNKDGDDSLEASEWAGPSNKTKIDFATGGYSRELRSMKMMKMMDADGDHKVTREEFLNHHRAVFAKLDTSTDQQLDAQEWAKGLLSK
ncbi:MAG TPA: calcium-binding protein [Methylotenera sp.]|nr:calcium-binding protein [Methylotenera sp.]HPV43977.1 calcium-binding protein [Methylotenera sp.]